MKICKKGLRVSGEIQVTDEGTRFRLGAGGTELEFYVEGERLVIVESREQGKRFFVGTLDEGRFASVTATRLFGQARRYSMDEAALTSDLALP